MKRLFRRDDTYNPLGVEIHDWAARFARQLLEDYPEISTRDLEMVVHEGMQLDFLGARLDRT